ncbi:hypothetical protein Hanom_Chr07g00631391 [Helianthus anomalus]
MRREMTASETPVQNSSSKKRKTGEGPSKEVPDKPTRITPTQPAPRRQRPFQDLYDKLSKDIGTGPAKEIFLLKHQVNETNVLRNKLKEQHKKNKELIAYVTEQTRFVRFQQSGMEKLYRIVRELCAKAEIEPMFSTTDIFDYEKFKVEEENRKAENAERKKRRLESAVDVNEDDESDE